MADINSAARQSDPVKVPKSAPNADPIWKPRAAPADQPKIEAIRVSPQSHDSNNLPIDPTHWPEDWRYAFIERSGMLMNTGVTQEEADRTAESIVRKQYAYECRTPIGGSLK